MGFQRRPRGPKNNDCKKVREMVSYLWFYENVFGKNIIQRWMSESTKP